MGNFVQRENTCGCNSKLGNNDVKVRPVHLVDYVALRCNSLVVCLQGENLAIVVPALLGVLKK